MNLIHGRTEWSIEAPPIPQKCPAVAAPPALSRGLHRFLPGHRYPSSPRRLPLQRPALALLSPGTSTASSPVTATPLVPAGYRSSARRWHCFLPGPPPLLPRSPLNPSSPRRLPLQRPALALLSPRSPLPLNCPAVAGAAPGAGAALGRGLHGYQRSPRRHPLSSALQPG